MRTQKVIDLFYESGFWVPDHPGDTGGVCGRPCFLITDWRLVNRTLTNWSGVYRL